MINLTWPKWEWPIQYLGLETIKCVQSVDHMVVIENVSKLLHNEWIIILSEGWGLLCDLPSCTH